MNTIKKSYGIYFSALLLLSFSMILFPLDFFHNHAPVAKHSTSFDKNSSSKHQFNIQTKADYCWVCSVHFDKSFTKASFLEKVQFSQAVSVFAENEFFKFFVDQIFTTLRGPPSK